MTLLTYQDGLFIRMRIAVEPELLFVAVAPLVLLLPTAALEDQGRGGPARGTARRLRPRRPSASRSRP